MTQTKIHAETTTPAMIIGGARISDGHMIGVVNPATGATFAHVPTADSALVDDAVAAARSAHRVWRSTDMATRCSLLNAIARRIEYNSDDLARLVTLEQGKPLAEAQCEVAGCVEVLHHYSRLPAESVAQLFEGGTAAAPIHKTPLGVVAGIIPWNYPLLIAIMKIAPALFTGNAILIKPAPSTPLSTLVLTDLIADLFDTPGLVQTLGDRGDLGPLLVQHPGIDKIAFTGSTTTGRHVLTAAGATLKRVTLELGGNDPAIVLDDAPLSETSAAILAAAFANSGQVCGAVKRVYVQAGIYDAFCEALARGLSTLVVGNGLDPGVTTGPVQNADQHRKSLALLAGAQRDGSTLTTVSVPDGAGYFVPPTLIVGLAEDHPLVQNEQFAPILPVQRFETEDDVVDLANASPFALGASVWSSEPGRAQSLARRLDAGFTCINAHNFVPMDISVPMAKMSGIGWLLGHEGIDEYLQAHRIILG